MAMIEFVLDRSGVTFEYTPEGAGPEWIKSELQNHGEASISGRAFTFTAADLISQPGESDDAPFRFSFASLADGYFRIPARRLNSTKDVLLVSEGLKLERKIFVAERNVRIFRRIAQVMIDSPEIVIGGTREDAIPLDVFRELLSKFPNSGELDRYANARVEAIIGDYYDGLRSAKDNYETYLNRRTPVTRGDPLPDRTLIETELVKFEFVRNTIRDWLKEDTGVYSEKDWQKLILKVVRLILPKYVAVLENVELSDYYSKPGKTTTRFMDLCLVDAGGNVDVIEIKKPFNNALLGKKLYRDNNVPTRELSGCIMQVEKYLFHLTKWGLAGEKSLTERYKDDLPARMQIRITCPKALIILGRDKLPGGAAALSRAQLFDLEVIKRKYANVIDILTYDDLLRRLNNIIASLEKRKAAAAPAEQESTESAAES
ncbi:MAG: Shedu immune nuclease family protein [Hyphomonadaceae bacterium]